ncbi:hypothetical protein A2442_03955 [Candidatus Campbellbacteria bacterium RIFOXYC2_FULL_35_25]|uniref:Uncharacterized protein n=1 Tax=Candidatus Campbellbacteria bacterium RIFOXYC2_FULL_35_25 TaxID=1797582 RepID=A0A1F5EJU1_9BACT|nr:MAG: hypothetical protein A2442_03955 [Candidatus Campbellbacteria bacterium RIFOXYC2_FULL_35_25]
MQNQREREISVWFVVGIVITMMVISINLAEIIDAKLVEWALSPDHETRSLKLFLIPTSREDILMTLVYCIFALLGKIKK